MRFRSLRGIHHSQLGSTPLGVGPLENHLLSNFLPWDFIIIGLGKFLFGFWWFPVLLRTFTSVCEPCRPIPHLTLSFFEPQVLDFARADLAFLPLQISSLTFILLSSPSLPRLFLPTATTQALSATSSIVHYRLFNQRCWIPRENVTSIPYKGV
ncbi:hypothetical protein N7537_002440 [Penicillium hordei]|uniref:Uncharacterized protein n=1 Tax=Penicillium hordei TaxID=40994 RepID=A0AAD6H6Y2_9EURO|nr:uncharacterized protein N7537_002440 [Penicillium hordei]KAJ5617326.1 hypothetical protein N7537_002440 [Penicillium hordei]